MIDGPYEISNFNSLWSMDNGKKFPKDVQDEIITNIIGYPVYIRRTNGGTVHVSHMKSIKDLLFHIINTH